MNTFLFTANHFSHCIISTEYWNFRNSCSFSLSQQEMFDNLVSLLFALFCPYLVKGSTKCVDICVKAEAPYFSFLKKNSEAMKLFLSQNCDSSHLIIFCLTNVFPPPLLCQTNGRNPPPIIKYPSISILKGKKCGQMKENRAVLHQRSICASKRNRRQWLRASSRSLCPTSVPQKHSDTSFFSVLFFWLKFEHLRYFTKQFLFALTIQKPNFSCSWIFP